MNRIVVKALLFWMALFIVVGCGDFEEFENYEDEKKVDLKYTRNADGSYDYQNVEFFNPLLDNEDGGPFFSKSFVDLHAPATAIRSGSDISGNSPWNGGCNGTMISNDLYITNAHCIDGWFNDDGTPADTIYLKFNWQVRNEAGVTVPPMPFADIATYYPDSYRPLEAFEVDTLMECGDDTRCPAAFYVGNGNNDRLNKNDYAILKIKKNSSNKYPGEVYGWTSIDKERYVSDEDPIMLITNSGAWKPKTAEGGVSIKGKSSSRSIHFAMGVQHGTSGSGILNQSGKLAGLVSHQDGGNGANCHNFGPRMSNLLQQSPILKNLRSHIGMQVQKKKLSSGVTSAQIYEVNGQKYLLRLKKSDGYVYIKKIDEFGKIENGSVASYNWTDNRWDVAKVFEVNGSKHLFLMGKNSSNKTVIHVNHINSNGTISSNYYEYTWSAGWSTAEFFNQNGQTYLYLYKKGNGEIHIQKMNSNGSVGSRVHTIYNWKTNYTTAKFFYQNGTTYIYRLRASDGRMYIHKINSTGKIGSQVDYRNWSSGYTSAGIYSVGDQNYLFVHKVSNGRNYINEISSTGKIVSPSVETNHWSGGWSTFEFFKDENQYDLGQNYMLFLKEGTGDIHIHRVY